MDTPMDCTMLLATIRAMLAAGDSETKILSSLRHLYPHTSIRDCLDWELGNMKRRSLAR